MKLKFCLRFFCLFLPFMAFAEDFSSGTEPEIIVNNRILAMVNGKSITAMDVMKKMDIYLSRAYPEESESAITRHQFFSQNCKHMLNQMIDNELIIADAEKMEMKISDADIRETIHERFGPNVMASLDALGISFDEAWQMIYSEMAIQRMSWYRIHSKALNRAGPQEIKVAFQDYLKKNPPKEEWKYQVLSIRAKTEQLGNLYAQKAHALIRNEPLPFETLVKTLKESNEYDATIQINVSDEYNVESKNLSESHKAILCNLTPGCYSDPTPQVSRTDKSIVHRIFHLKEHTIAPPPKFHSMVETLHDDLLQKEVAKEYPIYLSKLRKQFNFDEKQIESIPPNFQPFSLR